MVKNHVIHHRTCHLCEAMCGLEIETKEGKIIAVKGDKNDPFSQGYLCPKGVAIQDIHEDPDRLRKPIRKVNGAWYEISWPEAYQYVISELRYIQKKYGNDAVAIYQGNPSVHNLGTMLFGSTFFRNIKTKYRYSATSVDQLPHHLAAKWMFGHMLLLPIPDIDRTDFFLVLGGNPMVSNGSIMSAANFPNRVKALQERGGRMVVIDPIKTRTAEKADQHLFIKPGTDVYLLASIIHILFTENLVNLGKLSSFIKGFEELEDLFKVFTPELGANFTGIDVNNIKQLARDFAGANSAVCYGRMGVSTQAYGSLCHWMINLINILTGNFDRAGGAMFPTPAIDVVKARGKNGTQSKYNRWQSKVRNLPEVGGELPVATMAEDILDETHGAIKAVITSAGNPVLSTPNGKRLEKALEKVEFMLSFDIYLNETTRHADIILPPASSLEGGHYDLIFNNLAVRNVAKYSPAVFTKPKEDKYDWQIFKELGYRLNPKKGWKDYVFHWFATPESLLNEGLKRGPYKLNLKALKKYSHGLDLGPLKESLPQRLFTKDQKIDLTPASFLESLRLLPSTTIKENNLVLVGRRHLRSNNSWMHNSQRLTKGPVRCSLLINPQDAEKRNVRAGDMVKVSTGKGSILLPVEVDEGIMPGVVSIPHGWGHHREGIGIKIASEVAGVSVNDITDEEQVDMISGNAVLNGFKVDVEKAG